MFSRVFGYILLVGLFTITSAQAQGLTNAVLLKYPETQRQWFYYGSFQTASHTAALYDKAQGDCMAKWYFSDTKARTQEIETEMARSPEGNPTSTLLAFIVRDCGEFKVKG